jgi:hypothetical protein
MTFILSVLVPHYILNISICSVDKTVKTIVVVARGGRVARARFENVVSDRVRC